MLNYAAEEKNKFELLKFVDKSTYAHFKFFSKTFIKNDESTEN